MLHRETEARNALGRGLKDPKNALAGCVLRHFVRSWDMFAPFPATRKVPLYFRIMPSCAHRRHAGILKQMVLARRYSV
jgi:hypothetical protein